MNTDRYVNQLSPRDFLHGAIELASPPDVYLRLTELLDDPLSSVVRLSEVVATDPALTARLLKIVNSPFYGFLSQVSTIPKAITLIGRRELHDLVLATTVLESFRHLPAELVTLKSFWHESLRCAVFSRALASRRSDGVDSVFVAGLLHQIGHLILFGKLPELAREAILRHRQSGIALFEAERQVFGFDYAALGGELAKLWKLPPVLQDAIAFHITPERAATHAREAALVHLASTMATVGSFERDALSRALLTADAAWAMAGVNARELEEIASIAQQDFSTALAVFA